MLCFSIIPALILFLVSCLYLGYKLISASLILSLLTILVYLGALIVLFAYIWIYIPYLSSCHPPFLVFFPLLVILVPGARLASSPLSAYLYPSSLVLFLVGLLFWAIVVVVLILDLSLGAFSG